MHKQELELTGYLTIKKGNALQHSLDFINNEFLRMDTHKFSIRGSMGVLWVLNSI